MTQAEVYKMFREFLVLQSCYDEYMENYNKRANVPEFKVWANDRIYRHNLQDLISGAFLWHKTESGQIYWNKINIVWMKKVEKLIEKGGIKNAYKVKTY